LVLIEQVNVELPDIPPPKDFDDTFQQMIYMEKRMFDLNARFMPVRPLYLSLMIADDNSMYTMGNGGVDSRLRFGSRYVVHFVAADEQLDDFDRIADLTRCIMTEIK
jgi:hypothetical protein